MPHARPSGSPRAEHPLRVSLLLAMAIPALACSLCAQESSGDPLPPCASKLTLAAINREGACVERVLAAGDAAIQALVSKLGLTERQPELTMVTPATQRITEAVTGSTEVKFRLTSTGERSAIFRSSAMQATASIRFQSFGFTWDGGYSDVTKVRAEMQRISPYVTIAADDPIEFIMKVPMGTELVGIYDISLEMSYEGMLTIPQEPEPGWPERFDLQLMFLPRPEVKSRRQVGKGDLKLTVNDVSPVHTAGEPMPIEVMLSNSKSPRQRLLLPDHRSFFAAPLWYVFLDASTDEILDHGNVVPLEEMLIEPASVDATKMRLEEADSVKLVGSIKTRLRPGRESRSYTGVIGFTVYRDPGDQGLWQGQTLTTDFPFTILPYR